MTEFINYGKTELPIDIKKVEKKYKAKYIGDFAIMGSIGWLERPAQLYWQEKPPVEGFSHYFAIVVEMGSIFITSGQSIFDVAISAIRCGDEILYSRYRHDSRTSKDGKCSIDGGRDYVKIDGFPDEFITLKLDGPNLVVVDRLLAQDTESGIGFQFR